MFWVFDRDNCFEDSMFIFLNLLFYRMEIGREVDGRWINIFIIFIFGFIV